jgi:hypothetical protein
MTEFESEIFPPSLLHADTTDTLNTCKPCLICGDQNPKMNYDVRCCDSCKIFFRRNAHIDLVSWLLNRFLLDLFLFK